MRTLGVWMLFGAFLLVGCQPLVLLEADSAEKVSVSRIHALDETMQDALKSNMSHVARALEEQRSGTPNVWTQDGDVYTFRPQKAHPRGEEAVCRDFLLSIKRASNMHEITGHACRRGKYRWQLEWDHETP